MPAEAQKVCLRCPKQIWERKVDVNTDKKTKIAIYSRKSRFTGKGESIANQIEECKKYCIYMLHEKEENLRFQIYEDEGYSGKNFDRPAMRQLLGELQQYDYFVCYRLDRVSRSVSDFSAFVKKLEAAQVEFVSVSESFDTTKPMGRAMMNITSAFAELERDTITERIVDNMTALAKTGRWLGGLTPLGFRSKKIQYERQGKLRSYYKLVEIPEETAVVRLIYNKYLELGSLTKLSGYLMNHGIQTRNSVYYSNYSLKFILTNPVYCKATKECYDFLIENGYAVYTEKDAFSGQHGLIAYNKTNVRKRNGTQRFNDVKDWIVAIGEHPPVIESNIWIQVQQKLRTQSKFAFRKARTNQALLSGLVYCSCGSPMRPKSTGTKKETGERRFSYLCETKSHSKGGLCSQKNIQGNTLDDLVVSYLLDMYQQIETEHSAIFDAIKTELDTPSQKNTEEMFLEQSIQSNQNKLNRLVHSIENATSENVESVLFERIEELSVEIKNQKTELEQLRNGTQTSNTEKLKEYLNTLLHFDKKLWDQLDYDTKKNILALLIDHIEWDGTYATIYPSGISFLPEDESFDATDLATPAVSTMNC